MIGKIMRAVKSSNKKRGRNITIGAVVGMLLSCSVVIKADDYLWIKGDGSGIEFSKNNGGYWEGNPYPENSWKDNTYTNNIALSGTDNEKGLIGGVKNAIGYGLRLSGNLGENFNLVNNGFISGEGTEYGTGIYSSGGINRLKNIGIITGSGSISGIASGSGIYSLGEIKRLKNIGIITGTGSRSGNVSGSGISSSGEIKRLKNIGIMTGTSSSSGYGINNYKPSSNKGKIGNITNTGIIYGKTNAIKNNGGTITKAHNYGLLVSSTGLVVDNNNGTIGKGDKYGLAFTVGSDKYILDEDYSREFGKIYHNTDVVMGYLEDNDGNPILDSPITKKYTIINAKAETKDVIGTESLVLADGKLTNYNYSEGEPKEEIIDSDKKYILNGITNTLEVTGRHNELNNSVINALETAVVMDKDMTMLTFGSLSIK